MVVLVVAGVSAAHTAPGTRTGTSASAAPAAAQTAAQTEATAQTAGTVATVSVVHHRLMAEGRRVGAAGADAGEDDEQLGGEHFNRFVFAGENT